MTISSIVAKGPLVILALIMAVIFTAGCVDLEVDPDPPYPQKDIDYTYPEKEQLPPPWEDPENYPYVRITEPVNGIFVAPGEITVSGTYEGPELKSLEINGHELTLIAGTFTTTVLASNNMATLPISVRAQTTEGITSSDEVIVVVGQPMPCDEPVLNAFAVDFKNTGFDVISRSLSDLLDDLDLTGGMTSRMDENAKALFELSEATIGNVDINLESRVGGLSVDLLANDINLGLEVLGIQANIEADGLFIHLLLDMEVGPGNTLYLWIDEVQSGLARLEIDAPLIPELVDNLIEILLPLLIDALVEGPVEDLLAGLVADLDLTITTDDFTYSLLPSMVSNTDMEMSLGMDTQATLANVWSEDFQPEGFRATSSDAPIFESVTPDTALPYDMALALNDDFLNQLGYLLAAGGLLNFELTDPMLKAKIFSLLFFSFENLNGDTPLFLQLQPVVAPMFFAETDNDKNVMKLNFSGYQLRILADRGSAGMWEAMTMSIDVSASLKLKFYEGGEFSLWLRDMDINAAIVRNPMGQKNVDNINRVLSEALENILPDLLFTELDEMRFTIPALLGIQSQFQDLTVFGPGQDFLGVFLDLDYVI